MRFIKFFLPLISIFFISSIWANFNPVLADCTDPGDFCTNPGNLWGACSGSPGLQYSTGAYCYFSGAPCSMQQSCNTSGNSDSCSCGAPNHTLVSCTGGSLCTGLLGDGCDFCQSPIGSTPTPTVAPTSGPTPTPAPGSCNYGACGGNGCASNESYVSGTSCPSWYTKGAGCYPDSSCTSGGETGPGLLCPRVQTYTEIRDITTGGQFATSINFGGYTWPFPTSSSNCKCTNVEGANLSCASGPNNQCLAAYESQDQSITANPGDIIQINGIAAVNGNTSGQNLEVTMDSTQSVHSYAGGATDDWNGVDACLPNPGTAPDINNFASGGITCTGGNCASSSVWQENFTNSSNWGDQEELNPSSQWKIPLGIAPGTYGIVIRSHGTTRTGGCFWTSNDSFGLSSKYGPDGDFPDYNHPPQAPDSPNDPQYSWFRPVANGPGQCPFTNDEWTDSLPLTVIIPNTNPAGTISASPNPCQVTSGGTQCNSNITWSTTNVSNPNVCVSQNGKPYTDFGSGASVTQGAPWIMPGNAYTFTVFNSPIGSTGNAICAGPQLAYVTVTALGAPVTLSGSVYNTFTGGKITSPGIIINQYQPNPGPPDCLVGDAPVDSNGNFSISNVPIGQAFCLRGPSILGYVQVTNPLTGQLNYECQIAGGYYWPDACGNGSLVDPSLDQASDNAYNFYYTPIVIPPTSTPTPTPIPLSLGSCSLTPSGSLYPSTSLTWTANTPAGGSGNYKYVWTVPPPPLGVTYVPYNSSQPPPSGPSATWLTSYPTTGPVAATVKMTDNVYSGLSASATCTASITLPSTLNVSGDTHSNSP